MHKTHVKASLEYIDQINANLPTRGSLLQTMVQNMINKLFRVRKQRKLTKWYDKHHGRPSVMPSLIIIHPLQLPTRRNFYRPNNFT
jgi:hypothetical protein